MEPYLLQNTGYLVCVGLFSADIWCCHDYDDNRTEGKWSPILTFVLDEDVSTVSTVYLKLLCLMYSHIMYNFLLFSSSNLSEYRLHEHHLITPEITRTFWQGRSVQGANVSLSAAFIYSHVSTAPLSVSQNISTQSHPATRWLQIRGNASQLVSQCVLLNLSTLGVASQVVLRRQTGHLQPGLFACTSDALQDWQERFVTHSWRIKKWWTVLCVCARAAWLSEGAADAGMWVV